jgi:hypothetical protein
VERAREFPIQPATAFSGMVVDDMLADTFKFLCPFRYR